MKSLAARRRSLLPLLFFELFVHVNNGEMLLHLRLLEEGNSRVNALRYPHSTVRLPYGQCAVNYKEGRTREQQAAEEEGVCGRHGQRPGTTYFRKSGASMPSNGVHITYARARSYITCAKTRAQSDS